MKISPRKPVSHDEPERPPHYAPEIRITWKQLIGFPFILLIPVLTLFGVFGERSAQTRAASATLDMSVTYPERFRYRQVQPLRVNISNRTTQRLDTVRVAFDTAYIERFSSVRFDPSTKYAYTVELTDLKPAESRLVSVELWGQDYWRHTGRVVARANGDSVVATISTFVFP